MDFSGPDMADFANVARLNHGFLQRLRHAAHGRSLRARLPAAAGTLAASLTNLQIDRLAEAPFLLLSLRESDANYWRQLTDCDANYRLFDGDPSGTHADQIGAAALSFLWQLSQRNPYAARLVSGATLSWCEQLSACTLLDLLQRMARRKDCLRPRLADNETFWCKLLGAGLSPNANVRRAAHMTALQIVLTSDPMAGFRPLRTAACAMTTPSTNVADTGDRR